MGIKGKLMEEGSSLGVCRSQERLARRGLMSWMTLGLVLC